MVEYEEVMDNVFDCMRETKKVYMEIGIKCGFKLAFEIIGNMPKIAAEKQ